MERPAKANPGMTLVEVLLASALLAAALVPVFAMLPRAVALASQIEARTRATFLAQQEMERILAEAAANYSQNFSQPAKDLGGGFLLKVTETAQNSVSKKIIVEVGHDAGANGILDANEVMVTFVTIVADTTSS